MKNENVEIKELAKSGYDRYKALGGIINEYDYASAVERAKTASPNRQTVSQVESMADFAELKLQEPIAQDPRVVLYSILRNDAMPTDEVYFKAQTMSDDSQTESSIYRDGNTALKNEKQQKHHHSQMSDQQLFEEVLRMLGDEESLKKFTAKKPIKKYPNIAEKPPIEIVDQPTRAYGL